MIDIFKTNKYDQIFSIRFKLIIANLKELYFLFIIKSYIVKYNFL